MVLEQDDAQTGPSRRLHCFAKESHKEALCRLVGVCGLLQNFEMCTRQRLRASVTFFPLPLAKRRTSISKRPMKTGLKGDRKVGSSWCCAVACDALLAKHCSMKFLWERGRFSPDPNFQGDM